ncbi:hypothetical protein [Dactylosporangium sp. NPDC005555]|uniref:hypothetical protein n=1 Tax=Dactylosporangium sp. NPDC005555 TaxID=3154889 RepID=UPI0033B80D32
MSLTGRFPATVVALTTLASIVTYKFVLIPVLWRVESAALGTGLALGVAFLASLAPAAVYLWLSRHQLRRRPATFQQPVDGSAFVASRVPALTGFTAVTLMVPCANALPIERIDGTDRVGLPSDPVLLALFVGLVVVSAGLALACVWLPGPLVRLTAAGITVRGTVRRRDIGWDDLVPGGPHPPLGRSMRLLYRAGGEQPKRCDVPTQRLAVDPVFLATVVRHYAERSEHRTAIGTLGELERLETAYASWRETPAPVGRTA